MGLTKVTYAMIEGAVVNVLDYGADPTGTDDSTAAAAGVPVGVAYRKTGGTIAYRVS